MGKDKKDFVENLLDAINDEMELNNQRKLFIADAKRYTENDYSEQYDENVKLFCDVFSATNKINVMVNRDENDAVILILETNGYIIEITRNEYDDKVARFIWIDGNGKMFNMF